MDSEARDAETAAGLLEGSPLRRLRPPRRPRRRRFLSGESADSPSDFTEASSVSASDSAEAAGASDAAEFSSCAEIDSAAPIEGGVNIKSPDECAGSTAATSAPKSDCCFLRFDFPIRSAKTLRGGQIPFSGFGILAGGFEIACQFKCNHGVARFFVQIGELPDGVFAGAGPTNPGGDLFPVSHVLACIVAAEARYSQRRREVRGKRFLPLGDDSLLTAGKAVSILRVALLEASMARLREIVAACLVSCLLMTPVWGATTTARSGDGCIVGPCECRRSRRSRWHNNF